ncbi:MAG: hypothetical protein AAGA30_18845 [Planctomycetota bacterium]
MFQPNDGGNLTITNANAGNGFASFTNGNERIQFENIETSLVDNSGGKSRLTVLDGFGPNDELFSSVDLEDFEFDFDLL